ncbi:hypothetical protein K431DRAFT_138005 [Polychaeton citri CBS 116435]|uniref:Clustered mitochondria protein homolog n=1 Tax=Polychaeton citri CBS 116435 TaxID=1314669 RepID=A0A9P4UL88_9PEZI|nr:hypothetical protein K431DRAFT_138005 [Polychaeton citri CBS 116435]
MASNDAVTNAPDNTASAVANGSSEEHTMPNGDGIADGPPMENVFQLTIQLPHAPGKMQITVSSQEQVQDIRQSIVDSPDGWQYTCFHLEHAGKRVNDFVELSEVPGLVEDAANGSVEMVMKEDPYTEQQARMHILRVRELIGATGDRTDLVQGVEAGTSLFDTLAEKPQEKGKQEASLVEGNPVADYDFNAIGDVETILPINKETPPRTVKGLSLSAWNHPPQHLRMRGHLLYLTIQTLEGEVFHVTSHVKGFYVNSSSSERFNPSPKSAPKTGSAHSLLVLLPQISPAFSTAFRQLQEFNGQRDPLTSYQLSNSMPAAPWLVSQQSASKHQVDLTRTQEAFLLSGADSQDSLRDWNEELASTRELPTATIQDRIFRERLTAKLYSEFNEQAVKGAVLVARGEVQSLNPTENTEAQIFVSGNVFYSYGADGVGTFAAEGGDEAARVAVGKDVRGVRTVNQLLLGASSTPTEGEDGKEPKKEGIQDLHTAGTVIVDYMGRRVVGQSIIPGIFRQRPEGEPTIDYGGVRAEPLPVGAASNDVTDKQAGDGQEPTGFDSIAQHASFKDPFAQLSKALHVKPHAAHDKDGNRYDLEASVETKGLLGTDGRKYILDLYRTTPLDIAWVSSTAGDGGKEYPHRMAVLRPELVETYRVSKLREYIGKELEKKRNANGEAKPKSEEASGTSAAEGEAESELPKPKEQETIDVSGFSFSLNPDIGAYPLPTGASEDEKAQLLEDEKAVKEVCSFLTVTVIPTLLHDLQEGDAGFPMDGQSLTSLLHKRGINLRYLGELAKSAGGKADDKRMQALRELCVQEMVARAFKHVANSFLKSLPPCFAQSCISHLLNCFLGAGFNASPDAQILEELQALYPDVQLSYSTLNPESLISQVKEELAQRYRFQLASDEPLVKPERLVQMLREVNVKLGWQVAARDYRFSDSQSLQLNASTDSLTVPQTNGVHASSDGSGNEGQSSSNKKKGNKKKKSARNVSPVPRQQSAPTTFHPEDVVNVVPIVKEASPKSVLADEALDAGRMSIQQDQKDLGQELLLESLSLHEQIYGPLHPHMAGVYNSLSTLFYSLDEKPSALELAKKAVIVAERTLGVDHADTLLAYLNLSLFEHATGNTKQALEYVRHALDLWKIIYGSNAHPDSITTLNNAAVMLQSLKLFHDSRLWFEESLRICRSLDLSSSGSVNTATLLFQLAQALALDREGKEAVKCIRESYNIFKAELGPENVNTKEAETWLETLTASAVGQAKQASLLQNRRVLLRNSPRGSQLQGLGGRPVTSVGAQSANEQAAARQTERLVDADKKSVDELLRYINGESSSKQTTPKKKTANPKRRQGKAGQ